MHPALVQEGIHLDAIEMPSGFRIMLEAGGAVWAGGRWWNGEDPHGSPPAAERTPAARAAAGSSKRSGCRAGAPTTARRTSGAEALREPGRFRPAKAVSGDIPALAARAAHGIPRASPARCARIRAARTTRKALRPKPQEFRPGVRPARPPGGRRLHDCQPVVVVPEKVVHPTGVDVDLEAEVLTLTERSMDAESSAAGGGGE